MKKFFLAIAVFLSLFIISCKKEAGPTGPAGPAGPQGPTGIAGNANVTNYTYGSQDFTTGFKTLLVTTTQDTMDRSAWFVYLFYAPLTRWYFIPGLGFGGATTYRLSMSYTGGKVNIFIDRTGVGEVYAQARVVRVYANTSTTGGRVNAKLPDIDFTSYEAVKKYYNLPD